MRLLGYSCRGVNLSWGSVAKRTSQTNTQPRQSHNLSLIAFCGSLGQDSLPEYKKNMQDELTGDYSSLLSPPYHETLQKLALKKSISFITFPREHNIT